MKRLKRIFSNKVFYVFLIFIVAFFPSAIYLGAEIGSTAVGVMIGIDKVEEGVEVSILELIPEKSGKNIKLSAVKEEDFSEAIEKLSFELGKKVGLAHCQAVVLGDEIMYENIVFILDYFMRANNLSSNALIINSETTARELFEAIEESSQDIALTLQDRVAFDNKYLFSAEMNLETFFKDYLSDSNSLLMPIVSIEDSESSSSSGGGGSDSEDSGSSSSSSSGESSTKKKLRCEGRAAIVKKGIKVREPSKEELDGYNYLGKNVEEGNIHISNVTDENFTNGDLDFQIFNKDVSKKVKFDGENPYCEIKVDFVLKLSKASSETYNTQSLDSTKQYVTPEVKQKIEEEVGGCISLVLSEIKANNTDTLYIARDFNRFQHSKWKKYLSNLENEDEYLQGIDFRVSLEIEGKL